MLTSRNWQEGGEGREGKIIRPAALSGPENKRKGSTLWKKSMGRTPGKQVSRVMLKSGKVPSQKWEGEKKSKPRTAKTDPWWNQNLLGKKNSCLIK